MTLWRPQDFKKKAENQGRIPVVIQNSIEAIKNIREKNSAAEPVLTLRHLGHLVKIDYGKLRMIASRHEPEPYRVFRTYKRPLPGRPLRFRTIAVPHPLLMSLQKWINENIVRHKSPHDASFAYSKGSSIRGAASVHCGCQWLLKIDIQNFFENITESQVYKVFESMGYQPLIAFELARICTRIGDRRTRLNQKKFINEKIYDAIAPYRSRIMGHLPQGAPTSPQISNLVAYDLDVSLTAFAEKYNFKYTRYADDLIFSTEEKIFSRHKIREFIGNIYAEISKNGFTPNVAKTVVSGPGSRKLVLGLLVDRDTPRLTREFKSALRQHIYYLKSDKAGPAKHAHRKGGATTHGIRQHVLGLIQHARQIEPEYGDLRLAEFNQIPW